jgi:hypothetical protein
MPWRRPWRSSHSARLAASGTAGLADTNGGTAATTAAATPATRTGFSRGRSSGPASSRPASAAPSAKTGAISQYFPHDAE